MAYRPDRWGGARRALDENFETAASSPRMLSELQELKRSNDWLLASVEKMRSLELREPRRHRSARAPPTPPAPPGGLEDAVYASTLALQRAHTDRVAKLHDAEHDLLERLGGWQTKGARFEARLGRCRRVISRLAVDRFAARLDVDALSDWAPERSAPGLLRAATWRPRRTARADEA
ncbi:hypothetical protein JL721_13136 [Aureococcus anophagefferens]|nr:hypothetical protein JL721_13136 [Aureococcus anophagefferens]